MGTIKIRQKKIIGLGEIYEAFITALPILSAVQFISILAILYNQISPYLVDVFPWITLFRFVVILSILMILAMILVYKFLIPSIWTFRGKQLYGFESALLDEVKALRKEIAELRKEKK
jgi:MFS family permease